MFCLKWDNIDWSPFLTKVLWINVEMVGGWHGFAKAKTQIKADFFMLIFVISIYDKKQIFFQELIPLSVSIFCVRRSGHKRIFSRGLRDFQTRYLRNLSFILTKLCELRVFERDHRWNSYCPLCLILISTCSKFFYHREHKDYM